ncbi:CSC1-like protein [Nymphaea thermarum]|nr:CSC1-like protein [Nymphaea thermarum]
MKEILNTSGFGYDPINKCIDVDPKFRVSTLSAKVFILEEVLKHNNSMDRWLVMNGKEPLVDIDVLVAKAIMPIAIVSFDLGWGAAAPEPCDVYWQNVAIPFVSLSIGKLVIGVYVSALIAFYMIPIAFVQLLSNFDGLEKVAPFLSFSTSSFIYTSTSDRLRPSNPMSVDLHIINVYDQEYESASAFRPHVHGRIIASLII